MNRRLFPLALSLALLAGCAPAPEPTPEPTPTPAAAVDFHTFLDAVNEKRRAVIEDGEPLDVSDWTPAFADQNTTFTDGEMELLLTPHGPEENLTMEQAREDVETAFTLLRTTYGAYEYFGGDQVFDGLREDALARLEEADPGLPLADVVAEALYTVLSPVVRDGHFAVGRRHRHAGRPRPVHVLRARPLFFRHGGVGPGLRQAHHRPGRGHHLWLFRHEQGRERFAGHPGGSRIELGTV